MAAPFFMCNYTVTAFARNDNATSVAMAGSIAGSIFNIVFDYVFIFPVGLGFSGAALATAVLPCCDYVFMCSPTIWEKSATLVSDGRNFHPKHLISCCQLGVSAFVGEISSAVIALVFQLSYPWDCRKYWCGILWNCRKYVNCRNVYF